jgi:hypothetical protein
VEYFKFLAVETIEICFMISYDDEKEGAAKNASGQRDPLLKSILYNSAQTIHLGVLSISFQRNV